MSKSWSQLVLATTYNKKSQEINLQLAMQEVQLAMAYSYMQMPEASSLFRELPMSFPRETRPPLPPHPTIKIIKYISHDQFSFVFSSFFAIIVTWYAK